VVSTRHGRLLPLRTPDTVLARNAGRRSISVLRHVPQWSQVSVLIRLWPPAALTLGIGPVAILLAPSTLVLPACSFRPQLISDSPVTPTVCCVRGQRLHRRVALRHPLLQ
jgi:hypothetical protein